MLDEILGPILKGLFVRSGSREILGWKCAAWMWMGFAIGSFYLASWLLHPMVTGVAIGVGIWAAIASPMSSASAWILHQRGMELRQETQALDGTIE